MKKYKARKGAPFLKKDAQKVGEELAKVGKISNLTPEAVVETAKDKKSILNKYFDWNDDEAGEKWRLQQARNIVSHVVEIVIIRGKEEETKSFVAVVTQENERVYVTHAEAIKNPSYRKQLLGQMETTLQNLLNLIKIFSSLE